MSSLIKRLGEKRTLSGAGGQCSFCRRRFIEGKVNGRAESGEGRERKSPLGGRLSEQEGSRGRITKAAVLPLAERPTEGAFIFSICPDEGSKRSLAAGQREEVQGRCNCPMPSDRLLCEAPENHFALQNDGRRRRALLRMASLRAIKEMNNNSIYENPPLSPTPWRMGLNVEIATFSKVIRNDINIITLSLVLSHRGRG